MDIFTAINTRASSIKLADPAPTREHLEQILLAGTRAPDHGKLAPWRFVVLTGDARKVLGDAMAESLRAAQPGASVTQLQAEKEKPLRAPAIVAVAAHLTRGHKVPDHEQVHAVAAAVQNMILTAHALGYGTMWKTGAAARASQVKQGLNFGDDDEIVAFVYLGTNAVPGPVRVGTLEGKVEWR
ncbi:MAG TPA: nitroreductase [Steroidobacteraceae bacterium]|nr:nitroreductase [Steroidobacteraceae bacterium]